MSKDETTTLSACPSGEIGAYLDAELSPSRELELEAHFAQCAVCREELNSQKHFLIALSRSLEAGDSVEIPKNFAKTIAARAESRVIGLRSRSERIAAFAISILLLLLAAFALGDVFSPALGLFERMASVVEVISHLFYSLAFGVVSLMRNAVSGFAGQASPVFFIGFVFAVVVLAMIYMRFVRSDRKAG